MKNAFQEIDGGVTAPRGFLAGGTACGIRSADPLRKDLAVIHSPAATVAAGTFTTNRVKAAPVRLSMKHLKRGAVQALVANSGNANACTGAQGLEHARRMARAAGRQLGLHEHQVLVCSTGRIGVPLPIARIEAGLARLPGFLTPDGSGAAAEAIMTSDTFAKQAAVELIIGGKPVRIGGIAKGAGMINPHMATMLAFLTTDAVIGRAELQEALAAAVEQSFNRITVDGDMSTNDTVLALANGAANHRPLERSSPALASFQEALNYVTRTLAHQIVRDGEGATRFIEVRVKGARTVADAKRAAEAIANSVLVKCAWYGGDPNWGRILDALGYSGARVKEELVDIFYDGVAAVRRGMRSRTPVKKVREIVARDAFTVQVDLHLGSASHVVYTTDLTPEYVEFNKGE